MYPFSLLHKGIDLLAVKIGDAHSRSILHWLTHPTSISHIPAIFYCFDLRELRCKWFCLGGIGLPISTQAFPLLTNEMEA
jgi:hypothetical protein